MSETINFHWIYPRPSPRSINNSHRKQEQQPPLPATSQLIHSYLSSAAQCLNRTKSFHVPQIPPLPTDNNIHQQVPFSDNLDLAQSVPSNINHLDSTRTTPMLYHEHRFNSIASEVNRKPDGLVNTLRRSLKKNREKFLSKRSSTMKSCQSLNVEEPSTNLQTQMPMTPTLICRHQYRETNPDLSTTSLNGHHFDERSETDDQIRKKAMNLKEID